MNKVLKILTFVVKLIPLLITFLGSLGKKKDKDDENPSDNPSDTALDSDITDDDFPEVK